MRMKLAAILLVTLCLAQGRAVGAGKDWILVKNGMNSPITVLVKADQQTAPAEYRILTGDKFKVPLDHPGPYDVHVIPDDQKNSGYHFGPLDLQAMKKDYQESPLDLRGMFQRYIVVPTGQLVEDRKNRVMVYFRHPRVLLPIGSPRAEYMQKLTESGEKYDEPVPAGNTAVMTLFVPTTAKVTIGGELTKQTGIVRHYTTPALERGKRWSYRVRVEWDRGGHVCKETRDIHVRPGEVSRSYFVMPLPVPPPTLAVPAPPPRPQD
jgi:uncharacterized protein (TIGR03000 family)